MGVLKNSHPFLIINLIRKLSFSAQFYTWIKKSNSMIMDSSKYIGYFDERTEQAGLHLLYEELYVECAKLLLSSG